MTARSDADLCVIGAGSAGLSIAAGASQLGRKVVLIEKGEMGGDCLNYGCIPSKALLAAAARAQEIRDASAFGVSAGEPLIDFPAVMDHVRQVIQTIAPHDSQERFEGLGVKVIRAPAAFDGPTRVIAGEHEIVAKRYVLATGSSPFVPPIPGLDATPYFTNESIFSNRTRPAHLIVIGGGPIGVELAQAHRRLGAKVSIIEGLSILNRDDPEAVEVVRNALTGEGIELEERAQVVRAERLGTGVAVTLDGGRKIEGSHLLVAVGRRANLDGLRLDKAGVDIEKGKLVLTEGLRTTNPRIYAAGDVAGGLQFTHVAGDHASTLVRRLLFKTPARRRDQLAPRVTFCDPELASVGVTEADAKERGEAATTVRWDFANNDRAVAERDTHGFIKAVIGKGGRILGATIVGKGAGEQISLWSFAIANRLKISALTNYIAPYPTRSEISKRAGGAYYTPTLFSERTRKLVGLLAAFD